MSPANLSAQAYTKLINNIVMLDINPGECLQERQLAERLEMSRTPIREALTRLTHEGWIHVNARRNIEVRSLTEKDVDEVIEIRKLIELKSIDHAFDNRLATPLYHDLQQAVHAMNNLVDQELEFLHYDKNFHSTIIDLNVNGRLSEFWQRIGMEFLRMGVLAMRARNYSCASVQSEHEAIVAPLITRRRKDVRKGVVEHLENTRNHVLRCLK